MSRKRSADESIAALYTAAIDPEQWDVALKALTALAVLWSVVDFQRMLSGL